MIPQNLLMTILLLLSAAVVMMRCLNVIAHMSHRRWSGHIMQFALLSVAYSLIGGGAVGLALGLAQAGYALLVGLALLYFFDRRA